MYEGHKVKVYIPMKFSLYSSSLSERDSAEEAAYEKWLKHKSSFTSKSGERTFISLDFFINTYNNFTNENREELKSYLDEYGTKLNSSNGMTRKERIHALSYISKKLKLMHSESSSPSEKKNIQDFLLRIEA